jgi:hypothetical protein
LAADRGCSEEISAFTNTVYNLKSELEDINQYLSETKPIKPHVNFVRGRFTNENILPEVGQ